MMVVNFRNTFKDLAFFIFHCSLRLRSIIIGLIPSVIITLLGMKGIEEEILPIKILAFLMVVTVIFVIFSAGTYFLTLLLMVSKSNKTFLCEHTITIDNDKLIEETEYNRTDHYWKGIMKIKKTRGYIYLFIGQNIAHVIPIKAFDSPMQADQFFNYCKQMKQC